MFYQICDIVRVKGDKGLFEITEVYRNQKAYQYTITNNECESERYVKHDDLIFVCYNGDRKDI